MERGRLASERMREGGRLINDSPRQIGRRKALAVIREEAIVLLDGCDIVIVRVRVRDAKLHGC